MVIKILKTKVLKSKIGEIVAKVGNLYTCGPVTEATKFAGGIEKKLTISQVVLDDGYTYNAYSLIDQGFAERDIMSDSTDIDYNLDIPKYDNYPKRVPDQDLLDYLI